MELKKYYKEMGISATLLLSYFVVIIGLKWYPAINLTYMEVVYQASFIIENSVGIKVSENAKDFLQDKYSVTDNLIMPGLIYLSSSLLSTLAVFILMKYKLNTKKLFSIVFGSYALILFISVTSAVYFGLKSIFLFSLTAVYFGIIALFILLTSAFILYFLNDMVKSQR